jgi:hypothetical protein
MIRFVSPSLIIAFALGASAAGAHQDAPETPAAEAPAPSVDDAASPPAATSAEEASSPAASEAVAEPPTPDAAPAPAEAPREMIEQVWEGAPQDGGEESALSADQLSVFVMSLTGEEGTAPGAVEAVTGLIAARLESFRVFSVRTEDDLRQLVDFDELRTFMVAEEDVSRLEDIGNALGVKYLVTGRFFGPGPRRVDLALYDLSVQKPVTRQVIEVERQGQLPKAVQKATDALIRPVLAANTSPVYVRVSEKGAAVAVNDVALGTWPKPPQRLGAGPHTIVATKDGFEPTKLDIVVEPGRTPPVDLVLVPSEDFVAAYKWKAYLWLATAGSLGVLAGGSLALAGGLLLANQFRGAAIAEASGQDPGAAVLRVRQADFIELTAYRVGAVAFAFGLTPLLLGAGALTWLFAPDPFKYDELLPEGGE